MAKSQTRIGVVMAALLVRCVAGGADGAQLVQVGFGGYGIMVKKFAQNADVNQLIFSFYRIECGPILDDVDRLQIRVPKLRELPLFIGLGLTGMLGNQLLYIEGIYDSTPNIASVYQPAIPIWTALLVLIFRVEPLPDLRTLAGLGKVAGILLGCGGAAIIILLRPSDSTAKNMLVGNLCLLGNTLSMGLYIVLQKVFIFGGYKPGKVPSPWAAIPITVTAWAYLFGAASMGLCSLYYVNDLSVFLPPTEIIPPLIYAVLVSSGLCYGLISWANKRVSATLVTAFWPVQVIVTVILSKIIFDDSLVAWQYVGGAMIIAGLLTVTISAMWTQEPTVAPEKRGLLNDAGSEDDA